MNRLFPLGPSVRRLVLRVGLVAVIATLAPSLSADERSVAWTRLFAGVELASELWVGEGDGGVRQEVRVVRVDLRAPGIEFVVTPPNGEAPLETTSETTEAFLLREKLQVAVNTAFFKPCCTPGDKDLVGLAIAAGVEVSAPEPADDRPVLALSREREVQIVAQAAALDRSRAWNAVTGSHALVIEGEPVVAPKTSFSTTRHPRTAAGVTRDGRYLLLITIDGRQPGYSDGATLAETAAWLVRYGAFHALNLDGGGSTTLVMSEKGGAKLLNRPSGSAQPKPGETQPPDAPRLLRSNGANLGLRALP